MLAFETRTEKAEKENTEGSRGFKKLPSKLLNV
jgi:hypothetical protein